MSTPKAINPVKSKIPFTVDTSNHFVQVGVKAELHLTIVPAGFATGSNLKLTFLGQTWQFDFVASPDNSGTQLPSKLIGVDFDIWMAMLITKLNANQFIFPYYVASVYNLNQIWFTAREIGEAYTIRLGEANASVSQEVYVAGLDEIIRVNFGIHAQTIALTADNQEILLGEDRIAGNYVEFQVQNYLALTVKSFLYFPISVASWKKTNTEALKNFFIRYWERAAGYFSPITDTATYKAIGGGLTKLHEQLILQEAIDYTTLMLSGDILIQTNRPFLSTIHYEQPVQFYFVNHYETQETFVASLLIKYTDGSTNIPILTGGNSQVLEPDQQGCFIITPALHELKDIDPTKTIDHLSFKITAHNGIFNSETYVLNIKESIYAKGLLFRNSFDTWESQTFFGISETHHKYSRLFFEALSTKIQTLVSEKKSFIFNSGWLYKEEKDALRDLVRSEEIYLIYRNNLFRVNILSTETPPDIDNIYQHGLTLEMEFTGDDRFFSARVADGYAPGIIIADDNFIISDGTNVIGY